MFRGEVCLYEWVSFFFIFDHPLGKTCKWVGVCSLYSHTAVNVLLPGKLNLYPQGYECWLYITKKHFGALRVWWRRSKQSMHIRTWRAKAGLLKGRQKNHYLRLMTVPSFPAMVSGITFWIAFSLFPILSICESYSLNSGPTEMGPIFHPAWGLDLCNEHEPGWRCLTS